MTNVLFIRDLIYRLKQDYGQCMDLYVPTSSFQDYGTGQQIVSRRKVRISKVILLTEILQRRFVHDVAFLTAGRNFAYGGLFEEGMRTIIVAGTDIPKGVKINDSTFFTYLHVRYDVVKVEELEHRCGFIISMKQLNTRDSLEEVCPRADSNVLWTGMVALG